RRIRRSADSNVRFLARPGTSRPRCALDAPRRRRDTPAMSTLVLFHAHPDDEGITTGGTLAGAAAEGHRGALVRATPGELGEVPDGALAPGETLRDRRVVEVNDAARILGAARVAFLDYHDSGMAGEDTNTAPGAFAAADVDEAAERLAAILREE